LQLGPIGSGFVLLTFVNRSKKGSRRFRKVLEHAETNYIPHNLVKFSSNLEVTIGLDVSKKVNSLWSHHFFNNSTKTFVFKLHNNTLGYNIAESHFVRNHSPNCTFCDVLNDPEINAETPLHLFFSCIPNVELFLADAFKWITNDNNFDFSRQEFFTIFAREGLSMQQNEVLTLISKLALKFIWDSKQRFCFPRLSHFKTSLKLEISSMCSLNRKFSQKLIATGYQSLLE
jgi:hypothetical protein